MFQDALEGMGKTFGANVYDILNSRFFMKEFVGKFAVRKLEEIIEKVKEGREITLEEYHQRKCLVDVIGDEFIREKLTEELLDKLNRRDRRMMAREEIDRIERRKQYLEDLINAPGEERRREE